MAEAAIATDFADIDDEAINEALGKAELKAKLPHGFSYKRDGLYYDDGGDTGPLRVSDRIDVLAQTRDNLGASWGLLLSWQDGDGREHRWPMPMALLAGDGGEIRQNLLDRGCYVGPSAKARNKLLEFLGAVKIEARARAVERVGWTDGAFALPTVTIGDSSAHRVIYQGPAAFDHTYGSSGDLAGWHASVASYAISNSRLALSIAAAFVGPLLSLVGEEGGGINLRGGTSIGKSTALNAAASVWGPPRFVRQWRATSNGLEGVCVLHNETMLCLDEIGQLDPKEAGSIAYMIANGAGKSRAGRSGALRAPATWRLIFLSSGEISLSDLAGRDARGTQRSAAGQEVRILDVQGDAGCGFGLFENLHGIGIGSGEELSRLIKDGAERHYGIAGPAFVEQVAPRKDAVIKALKAGVDDFIQQSVPAGATGQVFRAARRFGLIATAGEIAGRFGILPWPPGEAARSATTMFNVWLSGRGGVGAAEDREALAKVRAFLGAHGSSRFEAMERDITAPDQRIINRVGFWELVGDGRDYLILPEAWKNEVCSGMDASRVARALAERGMLRVDKGGKYSVPRKLPGLSKSRVYIVSSSIFGGDDA